MVKVPEVLAVVPARGGSKGIPRKNIRQFAGFPLIAYSIAAAKNASMVTRIIVSTDDEEIAAVARNFGAETPFIRPAEFAQDQTTDYPVFVQALEWLKTKEGYSPDIVIQLRPTSPIRPVDCVDSAVRILMSNPDADSVRGVVPSGQNPHKMWVLSGENQPMQPLLHIEGIKEPYNAPRQVLPPTYWQTGHIDAIRTSTILEKGSMSGEVVYPLLIDPRYTVDIDNLNDWAKAEWLVQHGGLDMVIPGSRKRRLPEKIELVVLDFDGVLTDNRVWVDEQGHEMVAAYRSDSVGLNNLRKAGVELLVLSTENNPVVSARCSKLSLPVIQGVKNKNIELKRFLEEKAINPQHVVFVGNDTNDVCCFDMVGCAVVVADAQPDAAAKSDMILKQNGGHGAVRELCDLILKKIL